MAVAMPHGRDARAYIRWEKMPPNKKRPELFRVTGRPNSPPPELLNDKVPLWEKCVNSPFVPPYGTNWLYRNSSRLLVLRVSWR